MKTSLFMAAVWFIYLVTKPVYLLPHGLPQVSDIVLVLGMLPAVTMIFLRRKRNIPIVYLVGGMFAALTVAVNAVNYIFIPDQRFVLAALYYPYNFLIFVFVVSLFARDYNFMARITAAAIVIGLVFQIVSSGFFAGIDQKRMAGDFSNPNQLAYWALLSAAMIVFLKRDGKFRWLDFMSLGLAGYVQVLALSKAGIIAYALFMLVVAFTPQMPRFARFGLVFLVLAGGCVAAFAPEKISFLDGRVVQRIENIGQERDDSLQGRGYDRMIYAPGYMLIGAGEGGFERFRIWGGPNELHSGLGTILFSYGVYGLILFGAFLWFIFHRQPRYCIAILFAVLLFSLTSQTIRFTHTWVFLGVAYATWVFKREEENSGLAGTSADRKELQQPA